MTVGFGAPANHARRSSGEEPSRARVRARVQPEWHCDGGGGLAAAWWWSSKT